MISGQFNCLYLKIRLDVAADTGVPLRVALAVRRTLLVLHMCEMEVASVISNVSLAGTSQLHPSSDLVQSSESSVISVPILVSAVTSRTPGTAPRLVISISQ